MKHPIDPNSRIVGFRLDHELHKRLKVWCVTHECSLQDAFSRMVTQWVGTQNTLAWGLQGEGMAAGYTQPSTAPGTRP